MLHIHRPFVVLSCPCQCLYALYGPFTYLCSCCAALVHYGADTVVSLCQHFHLIYLNVMFTHIIFIRYLSVWRTWFYVIGRLVDIRSRSLRSVCFLVLVFPHGTTTRIGPRPPHYRGFMITLRHTTLGRTPLGE